MDKEFVIVFVDMYLKCGNVEYVVKVFGSSFERDIVMYNVMLFGYVYYGYDVKVFKFFEDMIEVGFKLDEIIFIVFLLVCRYSGLVLEGEKYFKLMIEVCNIFFEVGYYICMIDLYGKINRLDEVIELMKGIDEFEEDVVIFGVFLNVCNLNKSIEFVKEVEEKLLDIDGCNGFWYIYFVNFYVLFGRWDEMR